METFTQTNKEASEKRKVSLPPASTLQSTKRELTKIPDKITDGLALAAIEASLTESYQKLAKAFAQELVQEYDCKTPSEKALAQMAALAHAKALDYGQELRNSRAIRYHSSQTNGFFAMIGKEIDRANRQFTTAIALLKQMKAPALNINIVAKNAFVAQNQQINVNRSEEENNASE